jgi:hypothetical protein
LIAKVQKSLERKAVLAEKLKISGKLFGRQTKNSYICSDRMYVLVIRKVSAWEQDLIDTTPFPPKSCFFLYFFEMAARLSSCLIFEAGLVLSTLFISVQRFFIS